MGKITIQVLNALVKYWTLIADSSYIGLWPNYGNNLPVCYTQIDFTLTDEAAIPIHSRQAMSK